MSYDTLVFYAITTGLISLDRLNLRKKIIDSSETLVSLLKQPELKNYLESFYYFRYKEFFVNFLKILDRVKTDPYLKTHSKFFTRETRVVVYAQFL